MISFRTLLLLASFLSFQARFAGAAIGEYLLAIKTKIVIPIVLSDHQKSNKDDKKDRSQKSIGHSSTIALEIFVFGKHKNLIDRKAHNGAVAYEKDGVNCKKKA